MHSRDKILIQGSSEISDEEDLNSAAGSVCSCERINFSCLEYLQGLLESAESRHLYHYYQVKARLEITARLPYQFLETPVITIGLRVVDVTNRPKKNSRWLCREDFSKLAIDAASNLLRSCEMQLLG